MRRMYVHTVSLESTIFYNPIHGFCLLRVINNRGKPQKWIEMCCSYFIEPRIIVYIYMIAKLW